MAFIEINKVKISGIAASVPDQVYENCQSQLFESDEELAKYIQTTGVERRHVANKEQCASDLCFAAAEELIYELKWEKSEIDCLVFVSQTPDYIYPATACILQNRLGLSVNCMAFDVTVSCPGWIYGLSIVASLLSSGSIKKAILLVGETSTKAKSPYDKVNLLAGDAGTATALEFTSDNADQIMCSLHTDGADYQTLIIPEGGYRNPVTIDSFEYKECYDGIMRNGIQAHMIGGDILSFAIRQAPKTMNELMTYYGINKDNIDYYLIHQANFLINQMIEKRMKDDHCKFPYNIKNFGNTSSTTIPLMLVCQLRECISNKRYMGCAFGTGLTWASIYFSLGDVVCPELIFVK